MNAPLQTLADLPGPNAWPLVGNFFDLELSQLHRQLERWCHKFGPIFMFRLGQQQIVTIADPEVIQDILKHRPERYRRQRTVEAVFREIGVHGVFSAEGDDWERQRKLTARALDTAHLRGFFPVLRRVTERLYQRWLKAAVRGAAVEVQQDLMRYTVDVTTNLAFGYDMNTLEKTGDVIQDHLEKIFPAFNRRILSPFAYWHYVKLPTDHALEHSLRAIRQTSDEFVRQTRDRLSRSPELAERPTNFLEAMLTARDDQGAAFSDAEIFANILTMLLAGEDTTANTLAWMIHFMTQHPSVQVQLQQEADERIGGLGLADQPAELDQLEMADAVAQEAMRLKPVAPVFFMEPNEDVELKGVKIPAGTSIMLLTMYSGLQPEHFGEPHEFRPERWLADAATTGCPHHPKAFVPFGAGPRFCPGRNLAMLEIKAVTAMLARNFAVAKAPGSGPVTEQYAFTMAPRNLWINFARREVTPTRADSE